MPSVKRKLPPSANSKGGSTLQRRVKPRLTRDDPDISDFEDEGTPSGHGFGSEDENEELESDEDISQAEGSDEDESSEEDEEIDPTQLSFGALAKAQAALGDSLRRKKKRTTSRSDGSASEAEEDDGDQRHGDGFSHKKKLVPAEKRTSKHAPVEISSKKQVSRRRDFLTEETISQFLGKKHQARDPRFMPTTHSQTKIDEIKAKRVYSFLNEYRESEMQELRQAIKKTKNPVEKEKLQKALLSMESKKKAQEQKEKAEQVIEEHRRQEKELVKQGKTPFYLKRSEQKKRVLEKQFAGMKKGQVDKAIERRRKKVAGKEKKLLPFGRRGVEDRH